MGVDERVSIVMVEHVWVGDGRIVSGPGVEVSQVLQDLGRGVLWPMLSASGTCAMAVGAGCRGVWSGERCDR